MRALEKVDFSKIPIRNSLVINGDFCNKNANNDFFKQAQECIFKSFDDLKMTHIYIVNFIEDPERLSPPK